MFINRYDLSSIIAYIIVASGSNMSGHCAINVVLQCQVLICVQITINVNAHPELCLKLWQT